MSSDGLVQEGEAGVLELFTLLLTGRGGWVCFLLSSLASRLSCSLPLTRSLFSEEQVDQPPS